MTKQGCHSKVIRGLLLTSVATGLAVPAQANQEDIEARLDALQKEIEQLKQERQNRPAPANAVTGGDFPGSFKLPGTDTSIAIGGYVKGDVIGNLDEDLGDSFIVSNIPSNSDSSDTGTVRLHGRQTRLNLDIRTPTRFGEARAYVEGDFFGGGGNEVFSNSTSFRIRHAFGEFGIGDGKVLAGQTWTLFMPLASYPDTVDFFGPTGIPFIRQGQLRYTHNLGGGLSLAGSIENSELSGQNSTGDILGSEFPNNDDFNAGVDQLPDFVGAVQYDQEGWHFKLAGLGRYLSVDDDLPDGSSVNDEEFGWGVMAASVIPVLPTTNLNANFTYGEGVGRYLISGFGQDAFLDANGSLDSIESWGLATSLSHSWTDELTTNLVYGRQEFEDTFFADNFETLQTYHLNTWWSPDEVVRFGLEYIHGRADFEDGSLDNHANRIQFGAQWFF